MSEQPSPPSWWQTLPGILTATAAIITALTGLIVALYQAGLINKPSESAATGKTPTLVQAPITTNPAVSTAQEQKINLLAFENGGHLLIAPNDDWLATIDSKPDRSQLNSMTQGEAVYGFKDNRIAIFDRFALLIDNSEAANIKEFELLAGNNSPTGEFTTLGKFQAQNAKSFTTPYQEFSFPAVSAKYLKVRLLNNYGYRYFTSIYEFQLFGKLN